MAGFFIGGAVSAGAVVAWRSAIGDRRGRVQTLRADGTARVTVMMPVKGKWEDTAQTVDIPVSLLRHFVQAKWSAPPGAITAKPQVADTDLYLYGDIFADGGISAVAVAEALKGKSPNGRLRIFLSSPGGNPFEAVVVGSNISRWTGPSVVYIDGIAASAGTLIAIAAQRTYIAPDAMFMIHRASTLAMGDRNDMEHTMAVLDNVDQQMARAYSRKTGMKVERLLEMMSAETWMSAEEAKAAGFVDEIVQIPQNTDASARQKTTAYFERPWFSRSPVGAKWPEPEAASSTPSTEPGAQPAAPASASLQEPNQGGGDAAG